MRRHCCHHSIYRYGLASSCDLSKELGELGTALEMAGALGLYRESIVVIAQALYDANVNISVSSEACPLIRRNLLEMTTRVQALNATHAPKGGFQVAELGVFERISNFFVENEWAKFAAIGGGALAGLAVVSGGLAAGLKRGRGRKRRGRR